MKTKGRSGIAFDDVGDREPALLLMPGWCGPRDVFRPLYPNLDRRALALDWRGHGGSERGDGDFGMAELADDAQAVLETACVESVIPVALSHAGWVAIELRKRLGPERVPGVVLIDWMVLGAPPPFHGALAGLQQEATWTTVRQQLFAMWSTGVTTPAVHEYISKMAAQGFDMWSRAAREIAKSFAACPVPLDALATLSCPTLHIYAQPADPAFLEAQQQYSVTHPWFRVRRVDATSHFPMLEVASEIAADVARFAAEVAS